MEISKGRALDVAVPFSRDKNSPKVWVNLVAADVTGESPFKMTGANGAGFVNPLTGEVVGAQQPQQQQGGGFGGQQAPQQGGFGGQQGGFGSTDDIYEDDIPF